MMTGARKLVALHVSPGSERAKWILDHHGLDYELLEHMPIVGERRLRRLVGPGKPRATVPVLLADPEVLSGRGTSRPTKESRRSTIVW